jgi:FkbM family methyltransferase
MTCVEAVKLREVLGKIGENEPLRAQFIAACHLVESLPENASTPREDLTGPILDALHQHVQVVRKELINGIMFDFYYRSRIARDFIMSRPEKPDHVWEPQTTKLLLQLSAGASNVVVGGAYFGDQAILIADQLQRSGGGVCHAFEPDGDQADMLEHNARLNKLSNVRVNKVGLWSDCLTRLRLAGPDALATAVPVTEAEVDQSFPTITIDEYLRDRNIERVELIMLDLEGGELEALRGARGQLSLPSRVAPHVVFEVHRSYVDWTGGLQNTEIVRYLRDFGYRLYAVRDFQSNFDMRGRPIELVNAETAYLEGPPHGFNMLAVKDTAVIDDRYKICDGVSPKLLLHRDPKLHYPTDGLPLV